MTPRLNSSRIIILRPGVKKIIGFIPYFTGIKLKWLTRKEIVKIDGAKAFKLKR